MINWLLALGFLLMGLYQLWLLPLWLLPSNPWWGLSLIPIALLANTYWSLLHEAFHGSFTPNARNNVMAGRILAWFFGSPFYLLRLGHLLHHGFNRTERERIEVYDDTQIPRWKAASNYYFQLLGGLYLQEFAANLLFLLPKKVIRYWFGGGDGLLPIMARKLTAPEMLHALRLDALLILSFFASAFWFYGEHAWMLLAALFVRAFLISFADYVYHYSTPLENIISGRNLYLPHALSKMILHFNLHGVHHNQPQLGWRELPATFKETEDRYAGPMHRALVRQLLGPIPLSRIAIMPVTQGLKRI